MIGTRNILIACAAGIIQITLWIVVGSYFGWGVAAALTLVEIGAVVLGIGHRSPAR